MKLTKSFFADEPRRSGRATKGQYTKDRDISEKGTKRKGKGKGSKATAEAEANDDEENPVVRCICGRYEEEEETERTMICCDSCEAWQHNDCMGLPDDYATAATDKYFCEECKPEDHKELLAAIARGEKPWEEAARKREAAAVEAELASKKKGGKKGRKSGPRASDALQRDSKDAEGTQTPGANKGTNGHKRKLEEPSNGAGVHQVGGYSWTTES
jgi:PHD-finger